MVQKYATLQSTGSHYKFRLTEYKYTQFSQFIWRCCHLRTNAVMKLAEPLFTYSSFHLTERASISNSRAKRACDLESVRNSNLRVIISA